MDFNDDGNPGADDIKRQLKRMIDSRRLKKMPNRAALLEFVVTSALDGIELSEAAIGAKLFPGWLPDISDDVRVTATNLRDTLTKYYAEEGAEDPVVVTLPRGPKYRPLFALNSPAAKPYARGLHLFATAGGKDASSAIEQFNKAIALDPSHAPAYAARAEAQLSRAFFWTLVGVKKFIAEAEASAGEALLLNLGMWKPYVVMGMIHCCRCAWEKAEKAFDAAYKAAPEETKRHPGYAAYLLATGRKGKALQLVAETSRDSPGDPAAQSVYALFLYATRDYVKAEALLDEVRVAGHWLTRLVLGLIHQLDRESDEAWVDFRAAHVSLPGLEFLCLSGGTPKTLGYRELRIKEWFPRMGDQATLHPLQSALCYMALGDPQNAISQLRSARDDHDPWMVWAHLWPFFDSLREYPEFQRLIEEMNFPSER